MVRCLARRYRRSAQAKPVTPDVADCEVSGRRITAQSNKWRQRRTIHTPRISQAEPRNLLFDCLGHCTDQQTRYERLAQESNTTSIRRLCSDGVAVSSGHENDWELRPLRFQSLSQ